MATSHDFSDNPLKCLELKREHARQTAETILFKGWIAYEVLTAQEQRFGIADHSRSLLWRVARTLQDPELLAAADAFYTQCLERDPSLPDISQSDKYRLRCEVENAARVYFKKQSHAKKEN
jgi:hypothetical protein